MALDSIGSWKEWWKGKWLACRWGRPAGGNPALPIGAIVRVMVLCSPWPLLARRGICGNNQLLQ